MNTDASGSDTRATPLLWGLLAIAVSMSAISIWSISRTEDEIARLEAAHELGVAALQYLVALDDAETGQRGYLLTGDETYLEPYQRALTHLDRRAADLHALAAGNASQMARFDALERIVRSKLDELATTIELWRQGRTDAAITVVKTGTGKAFMDEARNIVDRMQDEAGTLLASRRTNLEGTLRAVRAALVASMFFAAVLLAVALARLRREARARAEAQAELASLNAQLECRVEERTRELRDAGDELLRSNRELDEFAYIASHDLKEPLRGIRQYAAFIREDYADLMDAAGHEMLRTLERLAARLEHLIEVLLQYSRVGQAELALDDVDLNSLVDEILQGLRPLLEESHADLRVQRPLPTVRCDPVFTGEILHNLVTNALKFNDKDHKVVEIGSVDADGGAATQVIYVRDNGIGIPEQHRDRVFQIFKRLHGRDQFGGGSGAGLTIVQKMVERHGGRIWLDSEPGHGTTFYFTLQGESHDATGQAALPDRGGQPGRLRNDAPGVPESEPHASPGAL